MEDLIKLHSEVKQYCVYAHYYKDQLFYIGSGGVYRNSKGLRGRPFNFKSRSLDWFFFCNFEIDQVTVEILFVTDDQKLSLDKEEEITRYYMELEMPLVNKNIGMHWGEEQKKNWSKNMSGENSPMYGKKHTKETKKQMRETHEGKILSTETKIKLSEANKGEKNPNYGKRGKDHPAYGRKHSEETRKKMGEALKGEKNPFYGKNLSAEHRKKIGEAQKGKILSEEHKIKISEATKGRIFSEEHRKNISEGQKGKILSEETKRKISESTKGKILSEETKRKLSLAAKGKVSPMYGKKHNEETKKKISENNANSKKVLVINNEINEEKIFDSIAKAYQFIVESGFGKTQKTLSYHLNKGAYNFGNYTLEKIA